MVFLLLHVVLFVQLLYQATSQSSSIANISTLRFVHVLFRHGDRNPCVTFPLDKENQADSWEGGLEELTRLGIRQFYDLGQFMKNRYKGFLSEDYNAKEISAQSTDTNRTIASALAFLAGMFPPSGRHLWNKNLPWQPIPVHTTSNQQEKLLYAGLGFKCPALIRLAKIVFYNSTKAQTVQIQNEQFFDFLRDKTGFEKVTFVENLDKVNDVLTCEIIHSDTHKRPEWATDKVFQKVRELYSIQNGLLYARPEVKRLYSGLLVHDIARKMMNIKLNKGISTYNPLKYQSYFAHDFSQIGLLQCLGVFDGSLPTYSQAILIEMHDENSGESYVKIYKKNDTIIGQHTLIPLQMPGCGEPCHVQKFYDLSLKTKPDDWDKECGL